MAVSDIPPVSIRRFRAAVRALASDKPQVTPGKWYRTQKEHWLEWLREYAGPGFYGRTSSPGSRDARFAYSHIVEAKMLLWLADAAGVSRDRVRRAQLNAARVSSMPRKSAMVRKLVPWEILYGALFAKRSPTSRSSRRARKARARG